MTGTGRRAVVLAVRVGPADVGRRVSVRELLADGRTMSDTVGSLQQWSGGVLTIRRRDGSAVRVSADRLVAGKVVAPELSAYDVQRVAEAGWPPEQRAELGDWTLRWAHGVTGRANSVRVGGDPDRPLADALSQVSDWYAGFGATPALQLPQPWTRDDELSALGWREYRRTLVMTAPVTALPGPEGTSSGDTGLSGVTVEAATAPDEAWFALLGDAPPQDRAVLREIMTRPSRTVFVGVREDRSGRLLGVGRASATALPGGRGRWAGITSVETAPSARRRGVAHAVLAALGAWAGSEGCDTCYLQLLTDNVAARSLYERLGFQVHHHYHYLTLRR